MLLCIYDIKNDMLFIYFFYVELCTTPWALSSLERSAWIIFVFKTDCEIYRISTISLCLTDAFCLRTKREKKLIKISVWNATARRGPCFSFSREAQTFEPLLHTHFRFSRWNVYQSKNSRICFVLCSLGKKQLYSNWKHA